jgi:hypothetical protein
MLQTQRLMRRLIGRKPDWEAHGKHQSSPGRLYLKIGRSSSGRAGVLALPHPAHKAMAQIAALAHELETGAAVRAA